jgi:HAD superfamily hydrolase (TIGR01484 family)
MRPQVIAIDLDGTLFGPDGEVSAANVQALARARDEGIRIVIATGRSWLESREAVRALRPLLDSDDLLIGAGGALLFTALEGRTIARHEVDPTLAAEAAQCLVDHGHSAELMQDPDPTGLDYLFVGDDLDPTVRWWIERYGHRHRHIDAVPPPEALGHTVRVGTLTAASRIREVAESMKRDLGGRLTIHHWPAVPHTANLPDPPEMVEAFGPQVNKWTMLRRVCEAWGVDPATTMAIGDGINDLELVAEAGWGVAMANADPRVLQVAKATTRTNREDGVAAAILEVLAG